MRQLESLKLVYKRYLAIACLQNVPVVYSCTYIYVINELNRWWYRFQLIFCEIKYHNKKKCIIEVLFRHFKILKLYMFWK